VGLKAPGLIRVPEPATDKWKTPKKGTKMNKFWKRICTQMFPEETRGGTGIS